MYNLLNHKFELFSVPNRAVQFLTTFCELIATNLRLET